MRAPVLVLALVLGASSALAQPVTPNCTPYGVCSVRELRAKSARVNGALTVDGGVSAASFTATDTGASAPAFAAAQGAWWTFGGGCSLNSAPNSITLGPYNGCTFYLPGKAASSTYVSPVYFVLGQSGALIFDNVTAATSLISPATAGNALAGDSATSRLWRSDSSRWTEVGGAQHPTMQGVSFTAASDRTAGANPPYWITGPRAGGALVTFTSAGLASGSTGACTAIGLCSSTPITVLTTTAVAGNQAHLSGAAAWFGPVSRFSTRVAPNPTSATSTSTRVFVGLSSALPLTAGSATPTAHAAVFRWDTSAGDTTWQACTGAGVAITCTDTGVAISTSTDLTHVLEIDCRPQSGFFPSSCTFWVDGRARVTRTTNLPAAAVGPTFSVETLTAAGRGLNFDTFTIETRG